MPNDIRNGKLYVEQSSWDVYVFKNGEIINQYVTESYPTCNIEWDSDNLNDELFSADPYKKYPEWLVKLIDKAGA